MHSDYKPRLSICVCVFRSHNIPLMESLILLLLLYIRLEYLEIIHPFLYKVPYSLSKYNLLIFKYYILITVEYYFRKSGNIITKTYKMPGFSAIFRLTPETPSRNIRVPWNPVLKTTALHGSSWTSESNSNMTLNGGCHGVTSYLWLR
jgi:hypothetical protein